MRNFETLSVNRCVILLTAALLISCSDTDDTVGNTVTIPGEGAGLKCALTNPFSQEPECKQYIGQQWTEAAAIDDCASGQYNQPGSLSRGQCDLTPVLGTCTIGDGTQEGYVLHLGGNNPDFCSTTARSCTSFLDGDLRPRNCARTSTPQRSPNERAIHLRMANAKPANRHSKSEPAGQGENGEVCTWNLISGCTEEGRSYYDYGSCETVRTNRPYYPLPGKPVAGDDDPRLADENYVRESNWVKSQVEACACICCHTDQAPESVKMGSRCRHLMDRYNE